MISIIMVIILGVLGVIACMMGIHSVMNEARLEAENERLRRLNNGQKLTIEELQTELFIKERV